MRAAKIALIAFLLFVASLGADPTPQQATALNGASVLVLFDLPAHIVGLELDGETRGLWNEKKYRHLIRDWGLGYEPGDSARISDVRIHDRQIEVLLGAGGFGRFGDFWNAHMRAAEFKAASEAEARDILQRRLDRLSSKELTIEVWQRVTRDTSGRTALRAIRSEQEAIRRELGSRTAPNPEDVMRASREISAEKGSRIRLRFRRRTPSTAMTRDDLLEILSPYLREMPAAREDSEPAEPDSSAARDD